MSLPWLQASIVEPQTIQYARHSFATTKRHNKVSKESVLCGSDNIGVKGKTIIEAQAVIRGDLSTIELGSYCVIARGAVIRPAEQKFSKGQVAYIPMTIGDHVVIEENSIVEAAQIGECTHIGKNCHVGPRCILSPCCELLDNSVLAANSVTAPFSIWAGCPAVQVGKLPESYQLVWQEHTRSFYRHFVPAAAPAGTPAATPNKAAARPAAPRAIDVSSASSTNMPPTTPSSSTHAAAGTPLSSPSRPAMGITSPALPPGRHRTQTTAATTPAPAASPSNAPADELPALPLPPMPES